MDFGSFLKKDETYKSICDGFSKRFNLIFVTALDYCHQMDLHLMQQQTEQSEELDSAQQKLLACMNCIWSRIEKSYALQVLAAFEEFKDRHQNDKPACSLLEFQQRLESFLEAVEKQINTPPPQEQQAPFSFPWFLQERFSGLVSAIEEDQRLTIEDRDALSFFILVLGRDSVDQTIDLTNKGFFGPQGIQNPDPAVSQYMDAFGSQGTQNPAVLEYMNALRGAYAVYAYRGTYPDEFPMMPEKSADR